MNTKLLNFCCKRCDFLCNHSNGDIFTCEDNMLFSHVKISCFGVKAHLVFHCCFYNKVASVAFKFGMSVLSTASESESCFCQAIVRGSNLIVCNFKSNVGWLRHNLKTGPQNSWDRVRADVDSTCTTLAHAQCNWLVVTSCLSECLATWIVLCK